MKLVNYSALVITVFFMVGIALGHRFLIPLNYTLLLCASVFLLFTGFFIWNRKRIFGSLLHTIVSLFTFISVGFSVAQLHRAENKTTHYSNSKFQENEVLVEGHISAILKPNRYYQVYILEVERIQQQFYTGKILLSIQKDTTKNTLEIGDEIILKSALKDLYKPLNPYQFDYGNYLEKKQIFKQITVSTNDFKIIGKQEFSLTYTAEQTKNKIIQQLKKQNLSKDQVAFTTAILLGERKELDPKIYKDFTDAGVVHILAISGLHVGIILFILTFLLKPLQGLKFGKWIEWILIVVLLWGYAFLIGKSPSVLRAVTMFSFISIGLIFQKRTNTLSMLCLSAFVLLVYNPFLILEIGFQMSYLAVLGIVAFLPLFKKWIYHKNIFVRKFFQILAVSTCAQIGVLPLSLYYFHQFPGLFLIANLVILPGLGILLGYGIVIILLSLMKADIPFLFDVYGKIIDGLLWFTHQIGQNENFTIHNIYFTKSMLLGAYLMVFLLFLFSWKKNTFWLKGFLCAVILFQLNYLYSTYIIQQQEKFFVLHQNRETIFAKKRQSSLTFFSSKNIYNPFLRKSFETELAIEKTKLQSIKNFYQVKNNSNLFIIDSLAITDLPKGVEADYILLSHSPKINLDMVLEKLQPKMLIIDGSNYRYLVNRWEATCLKKQLPFHFTGKKGAFLIEY